MKTRKTFAAVLAVLCMTGAMPAMTSSATDYDPCDVNRDGTVNMVDVVAINQHLTGYRYYSNYNQLDANQSHTVDSTDSICVTKKVVNSSYSACYIRQYPNAYMQPVSMPAISSTITLDSSVNQTNSRSYIGYSYLTGEDIPEYTLTVSAANLDSVQSYGLINNDENRGVAHGYENTGIVATGITGTGFIVGDHEIVTAAHCIHTNGEIRKDVELWTYDRTGELDGGSLTIAEIHVPAGYTTAGSSLDYALITVEEDLSDRVHFSIGNSYNMTNSEVGTIPIHVTGQPDQYGGTENTANTLYTHYGSVYGNNNVSSLYYTVDTSGGQSGAPVYTITRERYDSTDYYTYTVLAIHTSSGGATYNRGVGMNKYHLQFFNNNPYASYQQDEEA